MSEAAEKVKAAFLQLTPAEQYEIADWLDTIVEPPPGVLCEDDPGFIDEINRRVADFESGKTVGIPHEEVMRRMKEKYG
jgi:hypothetical protein